MQGPVFVHFPTAGTPGSIAKHSRRVASFIFRRKCSTGSGFGEAWARSGMQLKTAANSSQVFVHALGP
eukprot:15403706-Heterocapsa_arctica.AAC.1